ncbi:MAG TPA: hypothetical protein VF018_07320 [Acidobacteriaceae bacterium]
MRCSFAKLRWGVGACAALLLAGSWVAVQGAGPHTIAAAQLQQPQTPSLQQPAGGPPNFGEPSNPGDPMERMRQEKMEKARNTDRQKQLEKDTDKLLSLAKELKEEVGKSNADTLSVDVVKKAAEIEKLAKSVKERMRG